MMRAWLCALQCIGVTFCIVHKLATCYQAPRDLMKVTDDEEVCLLKHKLARCAHA